MRSLWKGNSAHKHNTHTHTPISKCQEADCFHRWISELQSQGKPEGLGMLTVLKIESISMSLITLQVRMQTVPYKREEAGHEIFSIFLLQTALS